MKGLLDIVFDNEIDDLDKNDVYNIDVLYAEQVKDEYEQLAIYQEIAFRALRKHVTVLFEEDKNYSVRYSMRYSKSRDICKYKCIFPSESNVKVYIRSLKTHECVEVSGMIQNSILS